MAILTNPYRINLKGVLSEDRERRKVHWQVEWLLLLPDGHLPELTQRNRVRTAVQPVSLDVRKQEMLQLCHPPCQAETLLLPHPHSGQPGT